MKKVLLIFIAISASIFLQPQTIKFVVKPYIQNMSSSGVILLWETNVESGTKLYIDDKLIVDNDGSHSPRRKSESIGLLKGFHKFYLKYFDDSENELLEVRYKSENIQKQLIPDSVFYH